MITRREFSRYFKPLFLLASLLVFVLGTGLARYLGSGPNWIIFFMGLSWVLVVQLAGQFLFENNRDSTEAARNGRTPSAERRYSKSLLAALACLTVAATLTVSIAVSYPRIRGLPLGLTNYLLMLILFLGAVFYSLAPFRFELSGYGELLLAFLLGFVVPAFGFTLQAETIHRLLPMVTSPLVLMILAMLITFELRSYARDLQRIRLNLMVRMGWQNAISLHNGLILSGYLLIGLGAVFGLPRFVVTAALISLPIGLFQIWQMHQIVQGKPPSWRVLEINGAACFASLAYLFAFAFWTH